AEALEICEALAKDFLKHFKEKEFPVVAPDHRLTVVLLADAPSFAKFLGSEEGEAVAGIYDLDTNRLVVFDNRGNGVALAARANTVALVHEATHQLCFNTGLLDRKGDVPLCISEGLATYGEVRRPRGPDRVGSLNRERWAVLVDGRRVIGRQEQKPL